MQDHPAEFDDLPLDTLEEAGGEFHRRIAVALRHIGEPRADDRDAEGQSPRQRVASLAVLLELAAVTCAAMASGSEAPGGRIDRHPAAVAVAVAALMYAAPTLSALVTRIEQDRRLVAAHARRLEPRFFERPRTAWGASTLRAVLSEAMLVEPARCAQALERVLANLDAAERRLVEAAVREQGE
ncbi:MAG: hypothetical protein O2798_03940 [Chloroflexi bacterium]|nr:hypothetical protein [Chloroflexota bacterium]MDA1239977.1 hypothetical protein [Chloroflexota bacterium]